jgi:hypothetical protein
MQKLRVYNSKILSDVYSIVMQMQSRIEALVEENPEISSVSELPDSLVPTDTLQAMLICYDVMFNLLRADHLIKDGHIKPSGIIH